MSDNTKEESNINLKEILRDLEDIQSVFNSYNVNMIVSYGALLGYYRDGKLLPGDDDIDICVIDKIDFKTRKDIGWDLFNLGFLTQTLFFNIFGRLEPVEPIYSGTEETGIIVCQRNFKFTIFFFKEEYCEQHGDEYVCIPKLGAMKLISTPKRFYEKLDKIKIGKNKYLCPSPIKEYLSFTYFNNWKDKSDRRHGLTYHEMHNESKIV